MRLGHLAGCHQLPDRSFHIHGCQFPLCARCTGICAGYVLTVLLTPFFQLPWTLAGTFCTIMFLDWLLQYTQLKKSTNLRRFVTGTLCGYGLMSIYFKLLLILAEIIVKRRG
ncbi:DUF2085 domain-containing protein [Pseudoflavonifractor phocaeensis]|uniref:DUF2085 domain-containing protein n=1 Tax=Pseudoflavonifractor phocaeensis TaxID=1870988 RepID=UPI001FAF7B26|nr:DUF2085 domain-containing protein [Pseudoflavonifractor phocaeensis]